MLLCCSSYDDVISELYISSSLRETFTVSAPSGSGGTRWAESTVSRSTVEFVNWFDLFSHRDNTSRENAEPAHWSDVTEGKCAVSENRVVSGLVADPHVTFAYLYFLLVLRV